MVSYFKYQKEVTEDEALGDDGTIRDGHGIRVSMQDAQKAREQHQLTDADYRVADYLEMQRRDYYSKPGFRNRVLSDQQTIDNQTVRDFEAARYEHDLVNAWRHPRNDAAAEAEYDKRLGGPNTASRGAAGPGQRGSRVGDPCTKDGARGTLEYGDDGELVCRVSDQKSSAPEEALSDHALNDAREASYDSYRRYVENAWRLK